MLQAIICLLVFCLLTKLTNIELILIAINCSEKKKEVSQEPKEVSKFDFNYYYTCERATQWYLKSMKENPNTEIAACACYIAGDCNNFRLMHEKKKNDKSPNPYLGNIKPGKVKSNLSCNSFSSFLKENGWQFEH